MKNLSKVKKKTLTYSQETKKYLSVREKQVAYSQRLDIPVQRTCDCKPTHINCQTPKDWIKSQLGVWQFFYEKRDIRDKTLHPATFPISLAKKVIELFSHCGELVLDPFVGSGTTLIAASDCGRNAVGFDLKHEYVSLCRQRLSQNSLFGMPPVLSLSRNKIGRI